MLPPLWGVLPNYFKDLKLKEVGVQPLPEDEERELSNIISEMGKVYGATKVCIDGVEDGNQCYNLEPGLTDIMAESTNFTLRTLVWEVSTNASSMKFEFDYCQ